MSGQTKVVVGGVVVAVLAIIAGSALGWWAALAVIAVVLGVPVAGYLMLDPSQRRRLRHNRRQLNR